MTMTKRQSILFVFPENVKTVNLCSVDWDGDVDEETANVQHNTKTTNKAHPHRISTNAEAKTWAKEFSEKCTTKGIRLPDYIVKVITEIKENGLKTH